VAPEVIVGASLTDPVLVHVGEQVILAKGAKESTNARTLVRGNDGAIG
jgi:hypothetical protein